MGSTPSTAPPPFLVLLPCLARLETSDWQPPAGWLVKEQADNCVPTGVPLSWDGREKEVGRQYEGQMKVNCVRIFLPFVLPLGTMRR